MDNRVVAIKRIDKEIIDIAIPSEQFTCEDIIASIINVGDVYQIVDRSLMDKDKKWRNAWLSWDSNGPVVDITKAKEIKKNEIRLERENLFTILDAEFMKALENNDTAKQNEIKDKKEILRSFPERVDNLNNLSEIENLKISDFVQV